MYPQNLTLVQILQSSACIAIVDQYRVWGIRLLMECRRLAPVRRPELSSDGANLGATHDLFIVRAASAEK